jgi:chitodextrinase
VKPVIYWLAILSAVVCLAGPMHAAPVWTDMIEGAAIPSPWSFYSNETGNTVESVIIDVPTLNRANVLTDRTPDPAYGKAQITRPNWTDGPQGVTVHCRFMVLSGSEDGAIAIQVPEGRTGGDANGLVKWAWFSDNGGQMVLVKPNQPSVSFSAPADTWVEIWETISNGQWKLWVKNGASWGTPLQGSLQSGQGVPYFGSGSFEAVDSVMKLDFARLYIKGAYQPTDPNRPVMPAYTSRIGEAKVSYPLGYPVDLTDKVVTNSWTEMGDISYNVLYVQELNSDRSAGVKVKREIQSEEEQIAVGSRVRVRGYQDLSEGEVFVVGDAVTVTTPAPQSPRLPTPLFLTNKLVSTGSHGLQPAYTTGAFGTNNTGLRIRICGTVTQTGYDSYLDQPIAYVEDATVVANDSERWTDGAYAGIKVIGVSNVDVGDRVSIAGNASVQISRVDNKSFIPCVVCRRDADVKKY